MLAEGFGNPRLRDLATGHPHDEVEEVRLRNPNGDTIQFEEDEGGHRSNPLVAVDERMIPHDVKRIGRCHLDEIDMEVSCGDSGPRHREGRTQERRVADSRTPAVPFDLVPVDFQDLVESQEARLHRLFSKPLERLPIATIDFLEGFSELLAAFWAANGSDDQAAAVRADRKRGLCPDPEEFQHGLVDHEC